MTATIVDATLLAAALLIIMLAALLVGWLANRFLVPLVEKGVRRSSNQWDDTLVAHGFFRRLGAILPLITVIIAVDLLFAPQDQTADVVRRLAMASFVLVGVRIISSFIAAALQIYDSHGISMERWLRGYGEVL